MTSLRKPLTLPEVRDEMTRQLAESGLSPKQAGYKPLIAPPVGLTSHPAPGYQIVYHDRAGKPTKFFRYRYVKSASAFGKPMRYVQPANVLPQVYWSLETPWKKVLADKEEPLFITEGEKKADCGCKNGFATIGLGGVWNFKSRTIELIEELADIDWENRRVYLVYDSDAISNPSVLLAERRLGEQLLARKAIVCAVRLPANAETGDKVGLDDFIVAHGRDEFQRLVDEGAEEFENSRALHEMNEEATVIVKSAEVLTFRNGAIYSFDKFKNLFLARTFPMMEPMPKGGEKTVMKRTASVWLEWRGHNQVEELAYEPGKPSFLPRAPHPAYNTWRGFGVEPETGDVQPFLDLVDYLLHECTDPQKAWFLDWLAYPIQNPGAKMPSCVLAHGGSGTGKSLLGEIVGRIYGENYMEVADDDLMSSFNEWCRGRQFVMGNEIGTKYRKAADIMKAIIAREKIQINSKFVAQYWLRDCINYYFTSNHPNAAYLEEDERRHFVVNVPDKPLPDARYNALREFKFGRGPSHLMRYLLDRDLSKFNPQARPPITAAKERMIVTGMSDEKRWAVLLRDNPTEMMKTMPVGLDLNCKFATPAQLEAMFVTDRDRTKPIGTKNLMSTVLYEAGFRQVLGGKQFRVDGSKQRFWILDQSWNAQFAGKDANLGTVKTDWLAAYRKGKK